ncbi:hypothetical protein LSPH24S_02406 [Lysinibacillus sphaericus]
MFQGDLSPYITSSSFVTYPFVAIIDTNQIIHEYNKAKMEELLHVDEPLVPSTF